MDHWTVSCLPFSMLIQPVMPPSSSKVSQMHCSPKTRMQIRSAHSKHRSLGATVTPWQNFTHAIRPRSQIHRATAHKGVAARTHIPGLDDGEVGIACCFLALRDTNRGAAPLNRFCESEPVNGINKAV